MPGATPRNQSKQQGRAPPPRKPAQKPPTTKSKDNRKKENIPELPPVIENFNTYKHKDGAIRRIGQEKDANHHIKFRRMAKTGGALTYHSFAPAKVVRVDDCYVYNQGKAPDGVIDTTALTVSLQCSELTHDIFYGNTVISNDCANRINAHLSQLLSVYQSRIQHLLDYACTPIDKRDRASLPDHARRSGIEYDPAVKY
ncbi:hypothetical protein QKS34_gp3 [Frankliniella occidentalis associated mesonivirus 1]|uniref:Uncharacterized protein n=1 Tax=Frankliniella occidentalis associated mesonivirus 1 TaxID=2767230 RepID=A0AAE7JEP1_9NIDO|nr:hypothetical protein QKS34_gp3 [Frankliniella occidentalis associated mesonivirus 1]QNM37796.1 hypothetical protein [Frankliniella occidentalis associated mesonivirus 1]